MLCGACISRCYEHGTRDVDTRVLFDAPPPRKAAVGSRQRGRLVAYSQMLVILW